MSDQPQVVHLAPFFPGVLTPCCGLSISRDIADLVVLTTDMRQVTCPSFALEPVLTLALQSEERRWTAKIDPHGLSHHLARTSIAIIYEVVMANSSSRGVLPDDAVDAAAMVLYLESGGSASDWDEGFILPSTIDHFLSQARRILTASLDAVSRRVQTEATLSALSGQPLAPLPEGLTP